MKIKVCGITSDEDLLQVVGMGVDYAGLIFYPPSSRYAAGKVSRSAVELARKLNKDLFLTAVFVDENEDTIRSVAEMYSCNAVQLHGDEAPELCASLKNDLHVIKAVGVHEVADLERSKEYAEVCDLLLFDSKGPLPGGNGYSWDWTWLSAYEGETPFMISGGIGPSDLLKILGIHHAAWKGIDLNSRFELRPGVKNLQALQQFIQVIKKGEHELFGQ